MIQTLSHVGININPVSVLRLRTQSIPQGTHVTVVSEDVMY